MRTPAGRQRPPHMRPNLKPEPVWHAPALSSTPQVIRQGTGVTAVHLVTRPMLADCIFTGWGGVHSPLTFKFQSLGNIRNTVFHNSDLQVEIADVSFEGIVRFENVSFANVTLEHDAVVSTTLNDYQQAIGFYLTYYADDDEEFDVTIEPVPPAERGVFGEEFRIVGQTMSDCIYLLAIPGTVLPGCPASSLHARNRTIDRGFANDKDRSSTGVPFSQSGPDADYGGATGSAFPSGPAEYSDIYTASEYADVYDEQSATDYEIINNPNARFEQIMLHENSSWLVEARKVPLSPLSPTSFAQALLPRPWQIPMLHRWSAYGGWGVLPILMQR